jgi:hypothetical protein
MLARCPGHPYWISDAERLFVMVGADRGYALRQSLWSSANILGTTPHHWVSETWRGPRPVGWIRRFFLCRNPPKESVG